MSSYFGLGIRDSLALHWQPWFKHPVSRVLGVIHLYEYTYMSQREQSLGAA